MLRLRRMGRQGAAEVVGVALWTTRGDGLTVKRRVESTKRTTPLAQTWNLTKWTRSSTSCLHKG